MQRTKTNRTPSAILTSDWHLREDVPICRQDNFWESQWAKVDFIAELQRKYDCPVLHGGDLFHHWKPSPYLLSATIGHIPEQFWTVYGQHDLPQHSLELSPKCGIYTLLQAHKLNLLYQCHWNQLPLNDAPKQINSEKDILVWHKLAYQAPPFPGATGGNAKELLQKYVYNLILTGDNHKSFVEEYEGRLLVNPGSLMRQSADQIDHKPRVYLWYAEINHVEPVFLPIDETAVSREHIDAVTKRDTRIEAFVEQLNGEWEAKLSFEDNLEGFIKANDVDKEVEGIIFKAIET